MEAIFMKKNRASRLKQQHTQPTMFPHARGFQKIKGAVFLCASLSMFFHVVASTRGLQISTIGYLNSEFVVKVTFGSCNAATSHWLSRR